MPAYYGQMQSRDDTARMPATVTVSQGRLRLSSGSSELGEWSLSRIGLEEYTDRSILLAAEDAELILFLDEHDQFIRDNERHFRAPEGTQRLRHPAFNRPGENQQSIGEELKEDVAREMSPIVGEAQHLLSLIEPGPKLWAGGVVLILLILFLPGLLIGLGLLVGVVALVIGGLGYADDKIAVRIPDPITPTLAVMIGGVSIALALFVNLIR